MNKTNNPRTIILLLIRIFLLTASVLLLTNLTVVQAQINPPACTKVAQPGPNLRAFLNTLTPGDVGCLRAGVHGARDTYAVWYPSGTPSAPITLKGYPGESTPTILGALYINGDNLVLSGLLFDGPTGRLITPTSSNPNGEVDQVSIYGDNVEVSHCEVRNNGYHAGIYLENAFNARLIGNYIHDNGRFGNLSSANMDHGIYFASGSGLIANNIVEHNWSFGVHIYPSASNVTVQQNTIIKNGKSGVIIGGQTTDCYGPCPPQPTNTLVVNNIIAFNGQHAFKGFELTTSGHIIKNNLLWGNAEGDFPTSEASRRNLTYVNQNNNIADPRFVSVSNYRLQSGSPAIDAALSPYTQRDDYDFTPRPQGAASDIGAFEFTPTPPTPAPTPTPTPPLAGTYDAVSDFSTTSNPSSAWSYGYKATSSAAFTRYTGNGQPWAGINSWSPNAGGGCCLMVTKNMTGTTQTYGGSIVQPADLLNLHPGPSGEQSTVRWTAPAAGTYQLKGRFQGIDTGGTTTNVRILHKGVQVQSGNINVFGAQAAYEFPLSVAAGDTVDFVVDYGSNLTYNSDSTGLAATITSTSTSPTPSPTVSPTPAPPTGGSTYNAVTDFSTTSNPTGAWSYGYKATSSSAFTRYIGNGQPWAGIYTWSPNSGGACCLMVTKNTTGATTTYGGSITQPADLLNLHPGPSGEQSTVRWTAPSAGTYQIRGRFQGIDTGGTTTNVRILHKDAAVQSGSVSGFGSQTAYDFALTVAAGDTVDFVVDYGSNLTYNSDSTGLAATITPITTQAINNTPSFIHFNSTAQRIAFGSYGRQADEITDNKSNLSGWAQFSMTGDVIHLRLYSSAATREFIKAGNKNSV